MPSFLDKWMNRQPKIEKRDIEQQMNEFAAVFALAVEAADRHEFARAIELYDQAAALNPSDAETYYKRANALRNLGLLKEALSSYDQAIARKPDHAFAYCNRGVVQQSLGLPADALSSYDQAIALDAGDALVHYNRALLLQEAHRWDEALAAYDRASSIAPGYADAQFNRSMALLFLGDFEKGWPGFESRWQVAQRLSIGEARAFAQPLWLGDAPIEGKRLLLHSEGGLGDTLQFCRYATLAAARGATVILEVQAPLCGLLERLDGISQVVPHGMPLPPFDYQTPLMSLPLAFKTTVDDIPCPRRYLRSDEAKVARWHERLGTRQRARIGLAWSGNPNNPIDPRRTVQLAGLIEHLPRDFDYVCLQTKLRPNDLDILRASPWISKFDDAMLGFDETAALCDCLDVIISVDTSIAHLSGALGKPTWLLLPFTPDWRWLKDRADSPWYPSMKLYRQKTPGDWPEVFARIGKDLNDEFTAG